MPNRTPGPTAEQEAAGPAANRGNERLWTVAARIRQLKAPESCPRESAGTHWSALDRAAKPTTLFNMGVWLSEVQDEREGTCETAGCIAGTTASLWPDEFAGAAQETVWAAAARILQLDETHAGRLFNGPQSRVGALEDISRERAAEACERLAAGCHVDEIWNEEVGPDAAARSD